jgi:hypothetical protein
MPAQTGTEMSVRMMVLLGGLAALLVAGVLGVSLLVRGGGTTVSPVAAPALSASPISAGSVTVPRMAGLDYRIAEKRLAALGLRPGMILRVPSARHADIVIGTYPGGGTTLPVGGRVTLFVSAH